MLVDEGDSIELRNDDGEYVGTFPTIGVRLWLDGKEYINDSFSTYGYNARAEAEAFIDRVRRYGSVNLSKWTQLDDRPFKVRYLENLGREY